jgi:hypothetical protein
MDDDIPLPFELPREQTVASARIDITTGSQQTLRWRETDSNHRSLARKSRFRGGEGDLRVIETEASHKKLFLLRGTDISNPSSSSSESAAKRTVAAPRAGRRRAPITGEGTESKKAIRRASVARPVASHTTGTARRTRAKVTDFYFGTKM